MLRQIAETIWCKIINNKKKFSMRQWSFESGPDLSLPPCIDSYASTAYQRHVFRGLLFSKLKQFCRLLIKNRKNKSILKSQNCSITDLNPASHFYLDLILLWSCSDLILLWSWSDLILLWSWSDVILLWSWSDLILLWSWSDLSLLWSWSNLILLNLKLSFLLL